ncbi:hypothetical protein BLA29_002810, partial [Euroglyphus maynei]
MSPPPISGSSRTTEMNYEDDNDPYVSTSYNNDHCSDAIAKTTIDSTHSNAENHHQRIHHNDNDDENEENSSNNKNIIYTHNHKDDGDDCENEKQSREYRKKLLISLAMLLPAVAAIIGMLCVMAWAISAEVALGAKREAQRRNGGSEYHHDYHFKRPNRYDYTRFAKVPSSSSSIDSLMMPQKAEMLVDDFSHNHDDNVGLNAFQQRIETLSKEFINHVDNDQTINELKTRLNQENLAELFAKLFTNHPLKDRNNSNHSPRIVVVAAPSQSSSSILTSSDSSPGKHHFISETRVTSTSKPKAMELKIASPTSVKEAGKNHHHQQQQSQQQTKSSKQQSSSKSRQKHQQTSTKSDLKFKVHIDQPKRKQQQPQSQMKEKRKSIGKNSKTVPMKSSANNSKPAKSKNYEKEFDSLLQKIENLEKQKFNPQKQQKSQSNTELFGNKNSEIVKKLRKFMDTAPKDEPARPFMYQSTQKQQEQTETEQMTTQQQQWEPP